MHIVHVCAHFTTKLEYQELALAREEIRTGHRVSVVTSEWNFNFPNYEATYKKILGERFIGKGHFIEEGINIYRLKLISLPNVFLRLKNCVSVLKKISPDLIICHGFEYGFLGVQSARVNVPVIIDSHWMPVYFKGPEFKRTYKDFIREKVSRLKAKYLLRRNTYFFGVTEESVDYITSFGIPGDRVKLIPLGANLDHFKFNEDIRESIRAGFHIDKSAVVLCFSGKVEEYKGVHLIIESMRLLNRQDLYLFIIGNGSEKYKNSLLGMVDSSGLQNRVFFIDFANKQELNNYFCASDIYITPLDVTISHLEAMAARLPIIVEDLKGIQHRLSNGNGLTVKANDVEDIAAKIGSLATDPLLRKKMGANGEQLVKNHFNWEALNKRILNLTESNV
jgi:glycosyltransferase involved in cell wall biosynthesis